jgi:RimJ/RimL family protein N-acetyltransferase
VAVTLRPSTEFAPAELARIFTAGYEGYFVPFTVDEAAVLHMEEIFDLDRARSVVAVDGGEPVGLANLGLRGTRTWLGGVGVVPAHRRTGVGELLTRALMDSAREAGAAEMWLEVIVENAPAIALYEKLGFERTRELDVLALPADSAGGRAEEAPLDVALALVASRRDGPEPWQRADETVARLTAREPAPAGLVSGDAAAVYRTGASVGLVQAAGGDTGLAAILAVLRAQGPVSAVNYPAGGEVSRVLQTLGGEVTLRQFEMAAPL